MKIRISAIFFLLVSLTGCMGIIAEKELPPSRQSVSWYENEMTAKGRPYNVYEKRELKNRQRIARMIAWLNISKDQLQKNTRNLQ